MGDNEKRFTVRIVATERVTYSKDVQLTAAQWKEFKAASRKGDSDFEEMVSEWLGSGDIDTGDEFEVTAMTRLDSGGKAVESI